MVDGHRKFNSFVGSESRGPEQTPLD